MMDVGEWLQGIGLRQYESKFRDHGIDLDVLPDLTEADLKKLGVALGSRKRMMKAIAELDAAARGQPSSVRLAPPAPAAPAAIERRPVTVLFCHFDGPSLPAKLDVEDRRDLYGGYVDAALAIVERFGGRVEPELGESLMAVFGAPQAQENDTERAVRAALAIQQAIVTLNSESAPSAVRLSARIGLDCGNVVVDAVGGVFGTATSVAARVQATAEPGSVLITANVLRQVAGQFIIEDRGPHELKGISQTINLYRIQRVASGRRRTGARARTLFVGRERGLGELTRRWERARSGEGQLMLIVGEPGIGKSRLVAELRTRLTETPHTWAEWNASQLLQDTPLHPITEWGRLRFDAATPPAERFAEIERVLDQIGLDGASLAPVVAPLFDLPAIAGRTPRLAPDELLGLQLKAIESWALRGARAQPAVLAIEDLQWLDPASLQLLAALAESGSHAPLFIIATARPEFRAPWAPRPHHAQMALEPLDAPDIRRMVAALPSGVGLSQDLVESVCERSGGVPLYVEEIMRLLGERGERAAAEAIPPSLQQSLAARLDRLGAAREVAEVGAVLGRSFDYALLREVADLPAAALRASLELLVEADILVEQGVVPEASYHFKHWLVRDAAYASLLLGHRQDLHLRAAECLRHSDRAATHSETIARHYAQAGRAERAIGGDPQTGQSLLRKQPTAADPAHKSGPLASGGCEKPTGWTNSGFPRPVSKPHKPSKTPRPRP